MGLGLIEIGRRGCGRRGNRIARIELRCAAGGERGGVKGGLRLRRHTVDAPEIHGEPYHGCEWNDQQAEQHGHVARRISGEALKHRASLHESNSKLRACREVIELIV